MSLPSLADILDPSERGPRLRVAERAGGAFAETADDPLADARALAAALIGYGLAPGSRVAVLGDEGRDALIAQLAVLAAGGALVPLDPSGADEALRAVLGRCGAVFAIASDERQLARLLGWRPDLPSLDLLLLMSATPSERRPAALTFREACEVGAAALGGDPAALRRAMGTDERSPALVYHAQDGAEKVVSRADTTSLGGRIVETLGIGRGAPTVVALPVTSLARIAAALGVASRGGTLALAPPSEPLDAGLTALGPRAALADVGALARLCRAWNDDIAGRPWVSRGLIRWALRRGADPARHPWSRRAADRLVLGKMRRRLGGRLSRIHAVGPPLHPEVAAFFTALGVPVRAFEVRMAR
jgi:long-subunit acyl-CoA synthetase (AMP-forming)